MSDFVALLTALAAGFALGAVFFGGLWWTVRRALSSDRPARWFVGSLLVRTGLTLAGFYLAADGHWERLLVCLAGFTVARFVVSRATRPAEQSRHRNKVLGDAS
jgi:F1F0 ATPase subunit 2